MGCDSGRITKAVRTDGNQELYTYDSDGNLVSKTDGDGYVTEYSYNYLDLVSHINYNDAKEVAYQYNKVGELVKMDDWLGTTTFEVDLLGQFKKVTDHKGNVVQYAYDAVGNQTSITYPDDTETVARTIADHMGADIFELTPTQPYTEDDLNWRDESSRVNDEHKDEALRDIELDAVTPENWADYDIVFVGYPIWWGIAAWPVNKFVKDNDFTGKTVIPFCTSISSGLGQSGAPLAELAGTGDWQTGQRFQSSASQSTVISWVKSRSLPTTPV